MGCDGSKTCRRKDGRGFYGGRMKPGEKNGKRGLKVLKKNETWRKEEEKRLRSVGKGMKNGEKKKKRGWKV